MQNVEVLLIIAFQLVTLALQGVSMTELRCGPGTMMKEKKRGRVCVACPKGTFSKGDNSACRPCRKCFKEQKPCTADRNTVCKDNTGTDWEVCKMYQKKKQYDLLLRHCSQTQHNLKKNGCNQGFCNFGKVGRSRDTKHLAATEASAEDDVKDIELQSLESQDAEAAQNAGYNPTIMLAMVCLCIIAMGLILALVFIQIKRRKRGPHTYCTVPKYQDRNKRNKNRDSSYVPLSTKDPDVTGYESVSQTVKGNKAGAREQTSCEVPPYVQIPITRQSAHTLEDCEYYSERPPQPLPKRKTVNQQPKTLQRNIEYSSDYASSQYSPGARVDHPIDTVSYICTPLSSVHSNTQSSCSVYRDISQLYIQSRGITLSSPAMSSDYASSVLVTEGTQTLNDSSKSYPNGRIHYLYHLSELKLIPGINTMTHCVNNTVYISNQMPSFKENMDPRDNEGDSLGGTEKENYYEPISFISESCVNGTTGSSDEQVCKEIKIQPTGRPVLNVQDPLQRGSTEPSRKRLQPQEDRIRPTPCLIKITENENEPADESVVYNPDIHEVNTVACEGKSKPLKETSKQTIHHRTECFRAKCARPSSLPNSHTPYKAMPTDMDHNPSYPTQENSKETHERSRPFKSEYASKFRHSDSHFVDSSIRSESSDYDVCSSARSCGDVSSSSYNSSTYDVTKPVTFKRIRNVHFNKDTNVKRNDTPDRPNINGCNDHQMESNGGAVMEEDTSPSIQALHDVMENTATPDIDIYGNSDVIEKRCTLETQQLCKPENFHENLVKTEGTQTRQNCENMLTLFGQNWDVKKYFSAEGGQLTKSTTNMSLTVLENSILEGETVLVGGRFSGNSLDVLPYLDEGWVVISPLAEFQMTYRKRWDKHVKIYIPYYQHNPKEILRVLFYHRTEEGDVEKGDVPQYDESKNQDMYYVKKPDHVIIHTMTFTLYHCACDHKFPLYLTSLVFTSYSKDENEAVVRLHIGDKLLSDKTVKAELQQKEKEENGTDLRKSADVRLLQHADFNGHSRLVFKVEIPGIYNDKPLPGPERDTQNSEGGAVAASPAWINLYQEQCPDKQERRFEELVECNCKCSEGQKHQYGSTTCTTPGGHSCHVEMEWTYQCNQFSPPEKFVCNMSITHEPPPGQEADRHGACQEGITWIRLKTPHADYQAEKKSSVDENVGLGELPSNLKHHCSYSFRNGPK